MIAEMGKPHTIAERLVKPAKLIYAKELLGQGGPTSALLWATFQNSYFRSKIRVFSKKKKKKKSSLGIGLQNSYFGAKS